MAIQKCDEEALNARHPLGLAGAAQAAVADAEAARTSAAQRWAAEQRALQVQTPDLEVRTKM